MVSKDQLTADMKTAMKERDRGRLSTIRMVRSEIKNAEISKGESLNESELVGVIARELKKRRESISIYKEAGRQELVDKESAEARVLEEYLPAQLGEDEIARLVDETVMETGAEGAREMGKVMAALMPKVKGRADGTIVSRLVKERLGAS